MARLPLTLAVFGDCGKRTSMFHEHRTQSQPRGAATPDFLWIPPTTDRPTDLGSASVDVTHAIDEKAWRAREREAYCILNEYLLHRGTDAGHQSTGSTVGVGWDQAKVSQCIQLCYSIKLLFFNKYFELKLSQQSICDNKTLLLRQF